MAPGCLHACCPPQPLQPPPLSPLSLPPRRPSLPPPPSQTLLWREVVVMTRNPADVAGRTLTFSWVALFVGLVYFDLPNGRVGNDGGLDGSDAGTAMQLRLNTLFNNTAFFMLMPYVSVSLFTSDRRYL
jgi:hypothetical protein